MSGFHGLPRYTDNEFFLGDQASQSYQALGPNSSSETQQAGPLLQHERGQQVHHEPTQAMQSSITTYLPANPNAPDYTITAHAPKQGHAGTRVAIYLTCTRATTTHANFVLIIEGSAVTCRASQPTVNGYLQYFTLEGELPALESHMDGKVVDLFLRVEGVKESTVSELRVGSFLYYNSYIEGPVETKEPVLKRRLSAGSHDPAPRPIKKTSAQQLQSLQQCSSSNDVPTSSTTYAQTQQQKTSDPPTQADPLRNVTRPRLSSRGSASAIRRIATATRPQSVPTDSSSNIGLANKPLARLQGLQEDNDYAPVTNTSSPRRPPAVSSMEKPNPVLIRSSTMPAKKAPRDNDAEDLSEFFNPYAMYADNKAFLELSGNLDTMAVSWTEEETRVKRRLVEFNRVQDGNQVTASFKPVTLEERTPNSICVSCIWWEEKDETFVTSVDTIQLLESLVAVRFTVEEKNRIRRNLEGYKPLTVAKGKTESEAFFKVIMDFPAPKPRNIEKDVKVFPWKILKHALQKIMSKYSASYASTASRITQASQASTRYSMTPSMGDSAAVDRAISVASSTSTPPNLSRIDTQDVPSPYQTLESPSADSPAQTVISGGASTLQPTQQSIPLFGMPTSYSPLQPATYQQPQYSQPLYPQASTDSWSSFTDQAALGPAIQVQDQWAYGGSYANAVPEQHGTPGVQPRPYQKPAQDQYGQYSAEEQQDLHQQRRQARHHYTYGYH